MDAVPHLFEKANCEFLVNEVVFNKEKVEVPCGWLDVLMRGTVSFRIFSQYRRDRIVKLRAADWLAQLPGDLQLLGARTLEGFAARVDSRQKRLVASGPIPAAGAIRGKR